MPLKEQSVKKQAVSGYYFSIASIKSSKESSNYNRIVCTGKVEYLREYSKKIEIVTRLVFWGQEKLFEEKTRGEKSGGTVSLSRKVTPCRYLMTLKKSGSGQRVARDLRPGETTSCRLT
jgi:hypothetical protein